MHHENIGHDKRVNLTLQGFNRYVRHMVGDKVEGPSDAEMVFYMLDKDRNGMLDRREAKLFFRTLGFCLDDADLDMILDESHDGQTSIMTVVDSQGIELSAEAAETVLRLNQLPNLPATLTRNASAGAGGINMPSGRNNFRSMQSRQNLDPGGSPSPASPSMDAVSKLLFGGTRSKSPLSPDRLSGDVKFGGARSLGRGFSQNFSGTQGSPFASPKAMQFGKVGTPPTPSSLQLRVGALRNVAGQAASARSTRNEDLDGGDLAEPQSRLEKMGYQQRSVNAWRVETLCKAAEEYRDLCWPDVSSVASILEKILDSRATFSREEFRQAMTCFGGRGFSDPDFEEFMEIAGTTSQVLRLESFAHLVVTAIKEPKVGQTSIAKRGGPPAVASRKGKGKGRNGAWKAGSPTPNGVLSLLPSGSHA
jgi:hypothetical protein